MRILLLSSRQCWPPITGAKLRGYYLARALGERAAVTYVAFTNSPGVWNPPELSFFEKITGVSLPQRYTLGKIATGLVGRWPLPVANYTSGEMKAALLETVRDRQFDILHLDSIHMAAYVPLLAPWLRGVRVVFDWHNIESEAMRRYGASLGISGRRIYAVLTAQRLAALERRILRTAFGHLVCSDRERDELLRIVPEARIAEIRNGVDASSFEGGVPAAGERWRIVFAGSMNYHANVQAALWFARRVWPQAHVAFPRWRFTLVGSDPDAAVLALRNEPGIEVTGTVPDVRPYYREAAVAVAPILTGGGTRLKILEAMAAGVPVLSTPLGAEGLEVSPGKDILIADRDSEWLPALDSLASDAALWSRLAQAGRTLIREKYDWKLIGDTLYQTYAQWMNIGPPDGERRTPTG